MQISFISRLSGLQHLVARQACTRPHKCWLNSLKAVLANESNGVYDSGTLTCCDSRDALIVCRYKCRPSLSSSVSEPCNTQLYSALHPFTVEITGRIAVSRYIDRRIDRAYHGCGAGHQPGFASKVFAPPKPLLCSPF